MSSRGQPPGVGVVVKRFADLLQADQQHAHGSQPRVFFEDAAGGLSQALPKSVGAVHGVIVRPHSPTLRKPRRIGNIRNHPKTGIFRPTLAGIPDSAQPLSSPLNRRFPPILLIPRQK